MTYSALSHWDVTTWSDEMEAMARDKFVPMIMAAGASSVKMVRTGPLSFIVFTEYTDLRMAEDAQAKITAIRAQAAQELPMKMASAVAGDVFAQG